MSPHTLVSTLGWSAALLAACAGAPAPVTSTAEADQTYAEVDAITLPALPDWTDKYAGSTPADMRFFEISAVMARYDLSRLEAVELQNLYRDASRTTLDGDPSAWFATALGAVRAGQLESGLTDDALRDARFLVVLDLDETLYDQRYGGADACHDIAWERGDGSVHHVKLAPGWDTLIEGVYALGGRTVIFSAHLDDLVHANVAHWPFGDAMLTDHPGVIGVMSNSYLVQQHKREGDPIVTPSKDLRIVDETLARVIIVDDNPDRVVQRDRLRVVEKFDAERFCTAAQDDPMHAAWQRGGLTRVLVEIEDAVAATETTAGLDFATAYLPYTLMGQALVDALVDGTGMTRQEAIAWVRAHPDEVDDAF